MAPLLTCPPRHPFFASGRGKIARAGEGIRTLDINLGKVALYQLSYARDSPEIISRRVGNFKGIMDSPCVKLKGSRFNWGLFSDHY